MTAQTNPRAPFTVHDYHDGTFQVICGDGVFGTEPCAHRDEAEEDCATLNAATEAAYAAGQASSAAVIAEMREALNKCARWFDEYASQPRMKNTQGGNLQAYTNRERSDYCAAKALTTKGD